MSEITERIDKAIADWENDSLVDTAFLERVAVALRDVAARVEALEQRQRRSDPTTCRVCGKPITEMPRGIVGAICQECANATAPTAPVGPKREQDKPKACRLCGEPMALFSPYDAHNDCAAHQPPPPAALTGHAGDCSIYRALVNGRDCDGICTCGYGWQQWRNDDITQLYSEERLNYMSKTPVDLPPPPAAPDAGTQEAEKICQNHPEHP